MFHKCGRCGLKTSFGLGRHKLFEYDVCQECFSELDAKLEEMEEEEEERVKEEASWEEAEEEE